MIDDQPAEELVPGSTEPTEEQSKSKPVGRRRFLRRLGLTAVVGGGFGAYSLYGEPDDVVVANVDVHITGWPATAAGMRIGQISDLHCDCDHAVERTKYAVALLLAQKPHVVAITGDYITIGLEHWVTASAQALAPLTSVPGGAVAILGNHDWWSGKHLRIAQELSRVGITVLSNDAKPIPHADGAWFVGLDDRMVKKHDPIRALAGVPADAIKILLVHEPDYADEAPPGFVLQLSGHSHGGQVRIPGLPPLIVPPFSSHYPEGLRQGPHHQVYTTRGVGMINPQIRLFCRPEVAVLRIYPGPHKSA